jgi:hypothetical protein
VSGLQKRSSDMDTKEAWEKYRNPGEAWEKYRNPGFIVSDEALVAMLHEVVDTIHTLERIYGTVQAQLLVRVLLIDYSTLSTMAYSRNLPNLPNLALPYKPASPDDE